VSNKRRYATPKCSDMSPVASKDFRAIQHRPGPGFTGSPEAGCTGAFRPRQLR
jgi:hypothetical protein